MHAMSANFCIFARKYIIKVYKMGKSDTQYADSQRTLQYCMECGTIVGILTSLSFLCSMYGFRLGVLNLLSNILGLAAIWMAASGIQAYRRRVARISFGRCCWMALAIYGFAILLTAAVQFVYFRFLDHGQLAMQIHQLLDVPEYRVWLAQVAQGEDVDELLKTLLMHFANPARATLQLVWMDCMVALMLVLPTALIGILSKKK